MVVMLQVVFLLSSLVLVPGLTVAESAREQASTSSDAEIQLFPRRVAISVGSAAGVSAGQTKLVAELAGLTARADVVVKAAPALKPKAEEPKKAAKEPKQPKAEEKKADEPQAPEAPEQPKAEGNDDPKQRTDDNPKTDSTEGAQGGTARKVSTKPGRPRPEGDPA